MNEERDDFEAEIADASGTETKTHPTPALSAENPRTEPNERIARIANVRGKWPKSHRQPNGRTNMPMTSIGTESIKDRRKPWEPIFQCYRIHGPRAGNMIATNVMWQSRGDVDGCGGRAQCRRRAQRASAVCAPGSQGQDSKMGSGPRVAKRIKRRSPESG